MADTPAQQPTGSIIPSQPLLQHSRPCGECLHHRREGFGSYCRKKLMGVTQDMRVGYYADPAPGYPGLCFEEPANG